MLLLRRKKLVILALLSLVALACLAITVRLLPAPWTIVAHVLAVAAVGAWVWSIRQKLVASEERQQVILSISHEMAQKDKMGDLLDYVVQASLGLVPLADKCVIHLLDEHGRRLYPRYSSQPDWHQHLGLPAGKGVAGQALRERRIVVIDDVRTSEHFLPLGSNSDMRALLVAPLRVHETVLGTLSLNSNTPGAFSEHDMTLMTIVATQLSSALQQSLLQEQAQLQERYVDSLLLHLPCGVALIDEHGYLAQYNVAFAHLLGPDPSRIVGQKISPDAADASIRLLDSLITTANAPDAGSRNLVSIHTPKRADLYVTVAEIATLAGRKQTLVIAQDQTSQQARVNELNNMLTSAASELGPGLDAIRGYAALLGGSLAQRPGPRGWAAEIQAKSGELGERTRDLEFLRAHHAGDITTHDRAIEMDELVDEWRSLALPQAHARGIDIQMTLDAPHGHSLSLDVDKLDHAVRNLLNDAIRRCYRGGQVTLTATVGPDDLNLIVQDNGRALAPQDHQCIISGQIHTADEGSPQATGTALALHVSKLLIRAMGGHLWIEQDANLGVKTSVILPLD